MLKRILEPLPEDASTDARIYLEMDHAAVNQAFVEDLFQAGPVGPRVIDLGCGPALIPILICEHAERELAADSTTPLEVMAVDQCVEMLELARYELEFAGRIEQIHLEQVDLTDPLSLQSEIADTIVCNSVLHHLPNPIDAVTLALRAARPGGRLFIRDLFRPDTESEVEAIVDRYCPDQPDSLEHAQILYQRQLLRQSLNAALTLDEISEAVAGLGIDARSVKMTSDRHWTIDHKIPPPENVS